MALLEIKGVEKVFGEGETATTVLRGVDLRLKRGESLSILGGSGAGKSTLLHIIGTLEIPSAGSVLYDEQSVDSWGDEELAAFRNKNLGFVFQFHYLLNEFTALENVAMPARIAGLSKKLSLDRAADLLAKLGMSHRESHFPGMLSGGEQQRVAVARALVMKPSLLLADEPTGNLDKKNSEIIKDLFLEIVDEYKVGLITVTHDPQFAKAFMRSKHMKEGSWLKLV